MVRIVKRRRGNMNEKDNNVKKMGWDWGKRKIFVFRKVTRKKNKLKVDQA